MIHINIFDAKIRLQTMRVGGGKTKHLQIEPDVNDI